jgi:L-ascorbate metabolism protein UlaG (beta-lactamase superfamily)
MRLTYFGHSCFLLETASARLVFDPNLTANPNCPAGVTPASLRCDYVLLSHGHEDHCCDALALAQAHGATIIGNYEISEYFRAQGAKTHGLNPGGAWRFPFGRVKLTLARHSSSLGDPLAPIYLGEACGVLVEADGKRVYHAGDTALFSDLHLVGRLGLDVALVPIGDNFTMGPEDALEALDLLKPKLAVPMHYNTWPLIAQNPSAFARAASDRDHDVRALAPGETLDF